MVTEINLLLFICLMFIFIELEYKNEFQDLILFYFVIQSVSSIFILRDFFLSIDFFLFNNDGLFLIAMLLKLAIFPFFFWIFKIRRYVRILSLSLILRIQKIPFFFVLFRCFDKALIYILIGSFIRGSLLIVFRFNFVGIIVSSSISYRF